VRVPGECEPPDGWVLLLYPPEARSDDLARFAHDLPRFVGERAKGFWGGWQAPGLTKHPVDVQGLLGIVRRQALRRVAYGVDVALEVSGEGNAGRCGPAGGEDGGRGVEGVEQVRHGLVVVERRAGLEDRREIPLQRPRLRLGHYKLRPFEARLRKVRSERALRDYLGLDPDLLPTPRLVQHAEAAVEGVEAARGPALTRSRSCVWL
jgi:hypothetical protein